MRDCARTNISLSLVSFLMSKFSVNIPSLSQERSVTVIVDKMKRAEFELISKHEDIQISIINTSIYGIINTIERSQDVYYFINQTKNPFVKKLSSSEKIFAPYSFDGVKVYQSWNNNAVIYELDYLTVMCNMVSTILYELQETRIVVVLTQPCNDVIVTSLEKILSNNGVYSQIFCSNLTLPQDASYVMQAADKMSMKVVLILATTYDTVRFLDMARADHTSHHIWFTNSMKEQALRDMYTACIYNIDVELNPYSGREILDVLNITNCKVSTKEWSYVRKHNQSINRDISFQQKEREIVQNIRNCLEENHVLKVAMLIDEPFVIELPHAFDQERDFQCEASHPCRIPEKNATTGTTFWRQSCCSGIGVEIFTIIADDIHVEFELYAVEDGQYGGFTNGTWTGIIGEVIYGKADVGLQGLTPTEQRLEAVEFTEHVMTSSLGFVTKFKTEELKIVNWKFLEFLEADILFAIIVSFFVVCITTFLYENAVLIVGAFKYFSSRDTFTYIAGLVFQRDLLGKTPKKWSARIIAIIYATGMTVVMTTYTANLTANNIMTGADDSFKGLKDEKILNPTNSFVYGVQEGTNSELFFKGSTSKKYFSVYDFLQHHLQTSDAIGMEKVYTGELDAYIGDYIYLKYRTAHPKYCATLKLYEEKSLTTQVSFALHHNSEWKKVIDQSIFKMKESKKEKNILNKWFYIPKCYVIENKAERFSWRYVGGLLVVFGCCVGLCTILLLVENIYSFLRVRREEKKRHVNTI
ncbi:glutamate receptor ionotropic, NMDA 3B-like isoform X2 [Hydractinia symbiolongicarpus]|uniref:glutamate receptor ionotropic, NMDA 3B-like isoform X2 n=1 Tax=Hydractinia symbiolongicarpus TaxID=13093 RepID=UPI00254C7CDE|nr:glutamate receptor ionotropic, NMDA 3B-like isoform X2 [Hydractinia symbiolongicarpus]